MYIWLLLWIAVAVRGDPDDYHAGNAKVIIAKQRLMAPSDPNNRVNQPGGIRARAGDQEVDLVGLKGDLRPIRKAFTGLNSGWSQMYPDIKGVTSLDTDASMNLLRLDRKLSSTHDQLEKQITGFRRNWAAVLNKKAESDPSTFDQTFQPVSQAFIKEYKQLKRQISGAVADFNASTRIINSSNAAVQALQNKTMKAIDRRMNLASFSIDQLLNRKALPLLIGTKYAIGAQIAQLGKASIDEADDLKNNVLADTTRQGSVAMDQSGDALKTSAQKTIGKAAKSVQRSLAILRSDLNKLSFRQQTWVNRNFTNIETMLTDAGKTVAKARQNGTSTLQANIDKANSISSEFKSSVLDSANDLSNMLSTEESVVNSVKQQSKLDSQQMSQEYSSEIAGLGNSVKNIGTKSNDLNKIQSQISSVYAASTSDISSGVSQQARGQAAALLSDASDQADQLSSMYQQVASQTQAVQSDLGVKAGVSNAQLSDVGSNIGSRTSDLSVSTMAEIDDSTAENEADRANVLSRFANGVSRMNGTLSVSLEAAGDSAQKRAAALAEQTLKGNSALVSTLSSTETNMKSQLSELGDIKGRLVDIPKSVLTQLDSQNEAKLQSMFSELTGLHQLSGNRGDTFEASASSAIAQLVSDALASGRLDFKATNTTRLSNHTSALKAASLGYKSSMDSFEASMNAELNKASGALDSLSQSGGMGKEMAQIVAKQQQALAEQGRQLIRAIYNRSSGGDNTIAQLLLTNPRVNVEKFLGSRLLNTSSFDSRFRKTLQAELSDLAAKRAQTIAGVSKFTQFLGSLKNTISGRISLDIGDAKLISDLANFRDNSIKDVLALASELNATISHHSRQANESISNKTENFYKQFQTASIVADSLVQGFADYIDKIISYEKATAYQREQTQASLIKSIQEHMASPVIDTRSMNASEIDRINTLVKMAMDQSDQSAEGIKKREVAAEALVNAVGLDAAQALQQKYQQLSANAEALSQSIQASVDDVKSDRVSGLEGSRMGLDGVSGETQLFTRQASGLLDAQKQNANAIASKIDELLSGGSFLTNITADQLGAILKNVQGSDSLYRSQMSAYQDSNSDSIATLGGVIESFANLVTDKLDITTDFLDMLTRNFTTVAKETDAKTLVPIKAIKRDLAKTKDRADLVNSTISQQVASNGPLGEALQERLSSLSKRNDDFTKSVNKQLNDFVATIHQMDSEIATSREGGIKKLRSALSQLLNQFRDQALQLQANRVDQANGGSLLQETDNEIRSDMEQRIHLVKQFIQQRSGNQR